MCKNTRPFLLGLMLAMAAVLVTGCDRLRSSLSKILKPNTPSTSAAASSDQVSTLDPANYDAFIAHKNRLVIIDFYADWCGPCRKLGPMLDAAAAAHPGVVYVGRINVDQARQFAAAQRVSSIPDVRIFKDGSEVDRFVGCPSEAAVLAKVDALSQGIIPAATAPAPTAPAQSPAEAVKPMPKNWLPPGIEKR